jgi:hypothetical protein
LFPSERVSVRKRAKARARTIEEKVAQSVHGDRGIFKKAPGFQCPSYDLDGRDLSE